MKTRISIINLFILFIAPSFLFAQSVKKEDIKVWGNCGMCKKVIETAAKKAGAHTALWDTETKMLTVSYSDKTTSQVKIQQAIAKSGYDTQDFMGDNSAYEKLPGCCHYDRKVETSAKKVSVTKTTVAGGKEAMEDCKDKDCCKKDGKTTMANHKDMDCCKKDGKDATCKEGKCDKKDGACKDKATCKEKGCCAS